MNKNTSEEKEFEWLMKWEYIIERIKLYMARKTGKELVVMNIEAGPNPNENYKRFIEACQVAKPVYEVVVTVSLPGEESIFWVNQDVQFYILKVSEKVQVTRNQEIFKEILYNKIYKEFLRNHYKWAYKIYDILMPFFERGFELLKNNKKTFLSFITSNKFLATDYGELIRKDFLNDFQIEIFKVL